jgi:hypothetical protein
MSTQLHRQPVRGPCTGRFFLTFLAFLLLGSAAGTGVERAQGSPRLSFSSPMNLGQFEIYLVNADGSGLARVTHAASYEDNAAISPDGTRIIYESNRGLYAQLFMINVDGTGEHRILSTNFYGQDGAWSPGGGQIAFTHLDNTQTIGSIWVVNADGSSLHSLSPGSADDFHPDWTPDGTRILFSSRVGGQTELFRMNADGTGRAQLSQGPGSKYAGVWSPDGSRLAYTLYFPPDYAHASIHLANADGSGDFAVTDSSSSPWRPAWSPDGTQIAFQSNRSGTDQLWRVNVDGSGLQRVTWDNCSPGDWMGNWREVGSPAAVADPVAAPAGLGLQPNPGAHSPTLTFALPQAANVLVRVLDVQGREVARNRWENLPAGLHRRTLEPRDAGGNALSAGAYFVRMETPWGEKTARWVIIR